MAPKKQQPIELKSWHSVERGTLHYWQDETTGKVYLLHNDVLRQMYYTLVPIDPLKHVQPENRPLKRALFREKTPQERNVELLTPAGLWQLIDNAHLTRLNKTKLLRYYADFYQKQGRTTTEPDCIHYTQGQCPWET